jgi:hypothetical protein
MCLKWWLMLGETDLVDYASFSPGNLNLFCVEYGQAGWVACMAIKLGLIHTSVRV